MKLGVAVSGKGSNLRNLAERGFEVVAVVTNRPACGGAEIARQRGIPLGEFPQSRFGSAQARDAAMRDFLLAHDVELLVCAGYDRIFTAALFESFAGRIVNVHPSLLPAFAGGMDAIEQALAAGVATTGCTVHWVTEEVDAGPVILQAAVPVLPGDDAASLRTRIQAREYEILPQAIEIVSRAARAAVRQ